MDENGLSARERALATQSRSAAAWMTIIGLAVVVASLGYSVFRLTSLQAEIRQLEDRKVAASQELDAVNRQLELKQAELAIAKTNSEFLSTTLQQIDSKVVQAAVDTAKSVASPESGVVPVVYIHFRTDAQRELARRLSVELQKHQLVVPGLERVTTGPTTSQIRYFASGDLETAEKIADLVRSSGVSNTVVALTAGSPKPGQYEVWLAGDASPSENAR